MGNANVVGVNGVMDGSEIKCFGRKIPCFLGVFKLDDLQKLNVVKNHIGFIIIHEGHAVALYTDENYIDVFDSLGLQNKSIISPICIFLKTHLPCKTLRVNTKIQGSGSENCAKYALLYLRLRSRGYSFNQITRLFSCDSVANDKRIRKLFNQCF